MAEAEQIKPVLDLIGDYFFDFFSLPLLFLSSPGDR